MSGTVMSGTVLASAAGGAGSALPETVVLVLLAAGVLAAYLTGSRRLVAGGSARPWWAWSSWRWRRWTFAAGVVVLVVAVLPPLDPVIDRSFVLHMAQHLVLMFAAAPLLALGAGGVPLLLALPRRWRRRVVAVRAARPVRWARSPAVLPGLGVAAFSGVLLVWHLPPVFDAALASDPVHIVEHASFLLAGWLLWAPLAAPHRQLEGGRAVLYVFLSGFPMSLAGAILVMAPVPLYPAQTGTGPGALAQQQMAGSLMWIPPGLLSVLLCALLVLAWLRRMEGTSPGAAPLPSPLPPALPDGTASRMPRPIVLTAEEVHR